MMWYQTKTQLRERITKLTQERDWLIDDRAEIMDRFQKCMDLHTRKDNLFNQQEQLTEKAEARIVEQANRIEELLLHVDTLEAALQEQEVLTDQAEHRVAGFEPVVVRDEQDVT